MERRDLYEDDLTEENDPTPAQREDIAENLKLDPQTSDDVPGKETEPTP